MNYTKKAIRDVETRWCSTHDMFERLLYLKDACAILSESHHELKLNDNEWFKIENTVSLIGKFSNTILKS